MKRLKTVLQALIEATQSREAIKQRVPLTEEAVVKSCIEKWSYYIRDLLYLLPSGSGFDNGTEIKELTDERVVFTTSFHHMNEHGGYCGWTDHEVWVYPRFTGISIRVTGPNKRGILDYIGEEFHSVLTQEAPLPEWKRAEPSPAHLLLSKEERTKMVDALVSDWIRSFRCGMYSDCGRSWATFRLTMKGT